MSSNCGLPPSGLEARAMALSLAALSVAFRPSAGLHAPCSPSRSLTLCSRNKSGLPHRPLHSEPQAARVSQGGHLTETPTIQQTQALPQ